MLGKRVRLHIFETFTMLWIKNKADIHLYCKKCIPGKMEDCIGLGDLR